MSSPCTAVTASPTPATLPRGSGTHVIITAATTGCTNPNPLYEFWIPAASQSSWQMVVPYSANTTRNWDTTGAAPGIVYIGVWARDASSSASFNAVASTAVTVTTPSCTGASVTPASPTVTGGAHDMITGVASGCTSANPVYEFWIRSESSGWYIAQPFSTNPTMNWNSAGAPVGRVYFGLWVKDAGSGTSTFDANGSTFVTVT